MVPRVTDKTNNVDIGTNRYKSMAKYESQRRGSGLCQPCSNNSEKAFKGGKSRFQISNRKSRMSTSEKTTDSSNLRNLKFEKFSKSVGASSVESQIYRQRTRRRDRRRRIVPSKGKSRYLPPPQTAARTRTTA